MTYSFGPPSTDPEAWHAARRQGVTASEVAMLAHGGKSVWANLCAEKAGGRAPWGGNEHTVWGHQREPDIAAAMTETYPWLVHNERLCIKDEDPRWMATPDMIGSDPDMLCQIKTAKWTGRKWTPGTMPQRYADQMQWEMLVTGTATNLLAVEFYDELPDGGFVPHFLFDPPHVIEIERDDERITQLVEIAEQFLAMGAPDTLDIYLADYARAAEREKAAKAEKEAARKLIAKEIAERPSGKYVGDLGSVTQGKDRTETVTVLDEDRLREEMPDVWARYAQEQTKTTKGRLTITPAKEAA